MPKQTTYHTAAREIADSVHPDLLPLLGRVFLSLASIAAKGGREETMQAIQYGAACVDYAMSNQQPEDD